MPQTVLTLISELRPELTETARRLIKRLNDTIFADNSGTDTLPPAIEAVPGLHFVSMMIFEDERFDPVLTVELNFDGPAGAVLPTLETPTLEPVLRAILRCCKPPEDRRRAMYEALTRQDARLPMAPYLETLVVRPAVFHQGNRGLDRDRIKREADLFDRVQRALDVPVCRDATDARALHAAVRAAVQPGCRWIDEPTPLRISAAERGLDFAKLAGLVAVVLVALLAPGYVAWRLWPALGTAMVVAALGLTAAGIAGYVHWRRIDESAPVVARAPQLPPLGSVSNPYIKIAGPPIAALVLLAAILCPAVRAALAGLVLVVLGIVLWLRRLELTDRVQDAPQIDPDKLRAIEIFEDRVNQNHMGSLVHVKPGILRVVLVRLGLHGLGLLLRVRATDGYLANMRTIHFAHWALIDNGSRLLFFSNFDSSWESYLDDFIEKAHVGLTLAWSNGIGFPRTRFLVMDGATNGPLFKTWARHSMAETLLWVSAYPELSVNQIERNCAIARGVCARSLSKKAAEAWAALL